MERSKIQYLGFGARFLKRFLVFSDNIGSFYQSIIDFPVSVSFDNVGRLAISKAKPVQAKPKIWKNSTYIELLS